MAMDGMDGMRKIISYMAPLGTDKGGSFKVDYLNGQYLVNLVFSRCHHLRVQNDHKSRK